MIEDTEVTEETRALAEEKAKEEIDKIIKREADVVERIKLLDIYHEDIVIINRLGDIETLTFLNMAEKTIKGHKQNSWYGKILRVSDVDSADEVRNFKKEMARKNIGKVISFNPDSAYSLNIAGFEEIWVMHIDNILVGDNGYDYLNAKRENFKKRFEVQNLISMVEAKKMSMIKGGKKPNQ